MKVYLTSNPNAELGYELKIVGDDGTESFQPVKGFAKDGSIHLDPSNPSGREWVTKAKFDKGAVDGQFELIPREKKEQTEAKPKTAATTSKGLMEYLTEDERKIIEDLKAKAITRKKVQDLKSQIEELQKLLEKAEKTEETEED